jgi:hypothetical protein
LPHPAGNLLMGFGAGGTPGEALHRADTKYSGACESASVCTGSTLTCMLSNANASL